MALPLTRLPPSQEMGITWRPLTPGERDAAATLGYTADSWDHGMDEHQAAHQIQGVWRAQSAKRRGGAHRAGADHDVHGAAVCQSAEEGVPPYAPLVDIAPQCVTPQATSQAALVVVGYECEHGCGFQSTSFDVVALHEQRCPQAT